MPALGEFYNAVTSSGQAIFWWVGEEANWVNVFCAFEGKQMVAKGQVEVFNIIPEANAPECKHKLFINLKAAPGREEDTALLDGVYSLLLARACEMKITLPDSHSTLLCVGNYAAETGYHRYFQERGYRPLHNLYSMERDLSEPIAEQALAEGLNCIHWSMETREEQDLYLKLESEVWPDAPLGVERLAEYREHPLWTAMIARDAAGTVVGSVMVWQEDEGGVIEDVFVREAWRRRGIASFLLAEALKYLQGHGLGTASLVARTDNDSALTLYTSAGFQTASEEARYYVELK